MRGKALGPYRLLDELGSGGMGRVYLARNGERVALKILHPHLLESPEAVERFKREAEIGQRVQHDNVVRTLDVGSAVVEGSTHHYLVMEYVEGQTLRQLLEELGRVPEELCRHIGRETGKGLEAIHAAGVVHRDLKPENVLITRDQVVKVMDLGVAKLLDEAIKLSQTGAFLGSVLYAAPELFSNTRPDRRADFYSLGLVLYELATGRHPFHADGFADVLTRQLQEEPRPAAELNPQLSPFFEEVCKALLEKDRERRIDFLPEDEESTWWKERAQAVRLETKQPLRRVRVPRETALYGRDEDLARLGEVYEQAKGGEGRVLLIEGEAGIGKTRLIDEFVGRLRQEGEALNFLFGSYPPGGAATAAGAFTTAYGEHFGAEGSDEYLTQTPLLVPAFDALLRGEPTPKGAEPLNKGSLQTCFVHATRSLADERPTIVLIDDLHFAPAEGRALFAALALAVPGHGVLLVGTMRPGVPEEWIAGVTRLDQCGQLSLSRLGPKDLVRLLEDSFQSERLAEELGTKIAVKSDGNPFFAFEIIRGLREGRFVTREPDGSWTTTRVIDDIQIPSSVMDLIQARVADLRDEERSFLDVASCCGFEFDPFLAGEVLGLQRIPLLRLLGQVERDHRLVRSVGRRFVFDHHQVQEALYTGLSDLLREEYHALIAEALEVREGAAALEPGEIDGAAALQLCEHFFLGARAARALRYLDVALDHLSAGSLSEQAVALVDRALGAKDLVAGERRFDLLCRKASWFNDLGRPAEEKATLDEVFALAEESGAPRLLAKAQNSLGWHLLRVARYTEAEDALSDALAWARGAGEKKLESTVSGSLGNVYWALGRQEEALAHFERHLGLAREIGYRRGEADALGGLGLVCWVLGRHAEARAHFDRDLALCREIGYRRGVVDCTGNIGLVLQALGLHEEALAHQERAVALAREIGFRSGEATGSGNLANALGALGRKEEMLAHHERHCALAREIDYRTGEGIALLNLAVSLSRLGDGAGARAHLEEGLEVTREIGDRRVETYGVHLLGELAAWAGDAAEARRRFDDAVVRFRELGERSGLAVALVSLGALLAGSGGVEEARKQFIEASGIASATGEPGPQVLAGCHLALLPDGDAARARAAFEEKEARLEADLRMEARFLLWKATGDRAHLAEAHRLLEFARDHSPGRYRDTMLENVPLHRDIMKAWEEHVRD